MRIDLKSFFLSSLMYVLFACSSPTDSKIDGNYTPLELEDETQIINLADSSTILLSIVEIIARAAREIVYMGIFEYSISIDTMIFSHIDTAYYFISNGYYTATSSLHGFEQTIGKPYL
jgi:hypothetical protein